MPIANVKHIFVFIESLDRYVGFFFFYLMTAICFNNDKNAYRRFGSLITQLNELVDTSWQVTGGKKILGKRKKNYTFNRYNTSTKACCEHVIIFNQNSLDNTKLLL